MSFEVMRELRHLKVLVLHPLDREMEELMQHLKRIGCQTELLWPVPSALGDVDVLFFAITPEGAPLTLPRMGERSPARVAIVDFESPSALKSLLDGDAHSFITKPVRASGILSALLLARSLHGYQSRLEAKVAKLEETLRSRREIERATRILMEMRGLDEDKAYQLIRSQATSQRLAMGAVARSIITAHRVFDGGVNGSTAAPQKESIDELARNVLNIKRR